MVEEAFKPFLKAQEAVSAKSLHQTLYGSLPEGILESGPIKIPFLQPVIKGQQSSSLASRKVHIRIAEERAEVIEGVSEAHTLKVDEERLAVVDHHVLGLKIPVHETAGCSCKSLGQG